MTVISIFLKASILLCAAALAHAWLGRRMSAAARHLLWTLTAAGLLILPALSLVLPAWPAFTTAPKAVRAPAAMRQQAARLSPETEIDRLRQKPAEGQEPAVSPVRVPWAAVVALVYAAGAAVLLLRLIVERVSMRRLLRHSVLLTDPQWTDLLKSSAEQMNLQREVRLFRCRDELMPMALGIRRAAIMVPAVSDMWNEDRRTAVLLHEMAHLARHDCFTQLLAAVTCALYWVHPGVWWVARRLRVERELACDDRVLSAGTNASEYAGHLLELAYALPSGRSPVLAVSMAGGGQLESRLLAILDAARNRAVPALRGHLAGLLILIALLVPLAAATISVRETREQPAPPSPSRTASAQTPVRVPDPNTPGTWETRPTHQPRIFHLQIRDGESSYSSTIDIDRLTGIPVSQLTVPEGLVEFTVNRDAGSFTFEGVVRSGIGAGTFTFKPNPEFAAELVKRGFQAPTPGEQRLLARSDIGFAFLDELAAQGYAHPANLEELIRAATRGVSLSYVREMGQLGYRFDNIDALVDMQNHGVSPDYIHELQAQGLPRLSSEDLVRARNSGVDPEYVRDLRGLGYEKLSLDELIQLRNHGVDPDYVRDLDRAGYKNLALERLIELRNHGVDPDYARGLSGLGYENLSLDALIELRNHGVDPDYVRDFDKLGYKKLSLETLVELRNHGVDPDYVKELQSLGYRGLGVEDLINLRNSGISADDIRRENARPGKQLSANELKAMAGKARQEDSGYASWASAIIESIREGFRRAK